MENSKRKCLVSTKSCVFAKYPNESSFGKEVSYEFVHYIHDISLHFSCMTPSVTVYLAALCFATALHHSFLSPGSEKTFLFSNWILIPFLLSIIFSRCLSVFLFYSFCTRLTLFVLPYITSVLPCYRTGHHQSYAIKVYWVNRDSSSC